RVLSEFTTLQTRGAEIPLAPGDNYTFTLKVKDRNTGANAAHSFRFSAGTTQAKYLPSTTP
ncbi:MAG: hypothetical protein FD130_1618, partial [Halothiobacillaceae bacterium]